MLCHGAGVWYGSEDNLKAPPDTTITQFMSIQKQQSFIAKGKRNTKIFEKSILNRPYEINYTLDFNEQVKTLNEQSWFKKIVGKFSNVFKF